MNKKTWLLFIICLSALLICPFFGSGGINPGKYVILNIRIPRVLLGALAGGTLALCGLVFQNMFKSVLATPFTLGTSSGASFGAALAICLGASGTSMFPIKAVAAFSGALLAIFIVYMVFHYKKNCTVSDMLLIGVAINFFFSSLLLLIQYLSDYHRSFEIVNWLLGKLTTAGYNNFIYFLPLPLIFIYIYRKYFEMDLLAAGDEIAMTRGVDVTKLRRNLFVAVSLAIALIVSTCGPIGFVGMMAPHICRRFVGIKHRQLIPLSLIFGATFLCLSDAIARAIIPPAEIPVGVITALCGGPFFLFLLITDKK